MSGRSDNRNRQEQNRRRNLAGASSSGSFSGRSSRGSRPSRGGNGQRTENPYYNLTPYERYLKEKKRKRAGRIIFWVILIEAVCLAVGAFVLLMPKEGALATLALVAVTAGLFLMLLALSLRLERGDRERTFFLGAVTLAAGLWKLSGLSSVPLILDVYGRQKAIWFVGALSYLLMMVLSLRLLTVLRPGGNKQLGKVCCFFAAGAALLLLKDRLVR